MEDYMTDEQYDSNLETIAKLIEASASTPKQAAEIVRAAKISAQK